MGVRSLGFEYELLTRSEASCMLIEASLGFVLVCPQWHPHMEVRHSLSCNLAGFHVNCQWNVQCDCFSAGGFVAPILFTTSWWEYFFCSKWSQSGVGTGEWQSACLACVFLFRVNLNNLTSLSSSLTRLGFIIRISRRVAWNLLAYSHESTLEWRTMATYLTSHVFVFVIVCLIIYSLLRFIPHK